ncbi:MAG: acyl-ACP--UDP-N-acetylglucosamine O-acyltransferase [Pseudomonadota bacterium]
MAHIHPTAVIEPGAELGSDVTVGPYSLIGAQVRIGEGTSIGPHCVIEGRTTIGRDNRIFQFSSLGGVPQDKKYAGEPTELHIGDRNTIREFCTFNLGTVQDEGITRLGDDNWMMAYTHLAHDCRVGNKTIFANNAQIAGHVQVGDWVILGAYTAVHQFVKIGAHAMTGMGTILLQDVPPFAMVSGNPAQARTMNLEGLKRRGFNTEQVAAVKQMHRLLYRQGHTLEESRHGIDAMLASHPQARTEITLMSEFLRQADRGIVR